MPQQPIPLPGPISAGFAPQTPIDPQALANMLFTQRAAPQGQSLSQQVWGQGGLADIGAAALHTIFPQASSNDYQTIDAGPSMVPRFRTALKPEVQYGGVSGTVMPEGFYSNAERLLEQSKQGIFEGNQLVSWLKAKGVKDEELKFSGLLDLANQPKVSKEQALKAVRGGPGVSEKVLSTELSPREKAAYERIDELQAGLQTPETLAEMERLQDSLASDDFGMPQYQRSGLVSPGPYTNYRELLLKHEPPTPMPANADEKALLHAKEWFGIRDDVWAGMHPYDRQSYLEQALENPAFKERLSSPVPTPEKFKGSHWDEPNVVSHLRLSDRQTLDGQKALHVEESQSDWANEAKQKGIAAPFTIKDLKEGMYVGQAPLSARAERGVEQLGEFYFPHPLTSGGISGYGNTEAEARQSAVDFLNKYHRKPGVEDAPYIRGGWQDLNARRAVLEAAKDPDVKHLTWTTGKEQADRYSLDKHFTGIGYDPDTSSLSVVPKDGSNTVRRMVTKEQLPDYIGRELTDRLLKSEGGTIQTVTGMGAQTRFDREMYPHALSGSDLAWEDPDKRIGYDQIFRKAVEKASGQKATKVKLQNEPINPDYAGFSGYNKADPGHEVWSIPITSELRTKLTKPVSHGGGVSLYEFIPPMLSAHQKDSKVPAAPQMLKAH